MAIIYTYPIKTNPVVGDLVVITDSQDKNFTKQTNIGAILDLLDCAKVESKCGFCTTSLSAINSPAGTAVVADDCGDSITFTSSDASVTITGDGLTKTIDFKSTGAGSCPTSYVIKPVVCDEETGDCDIVAKMELWTYTSDCFFAAYAPGYIKDFKINGVAFDPSGKAGDPSNYTCYFVEEAIFTASASDCSECCDIPEDPVILLTPCNGKAPIYETLQSNITGWDAGYLDNPCIFLDIKQGIENYTCYRASLGSVDSGIAIEITNATAQAEPCDCDCCLFPCSFTLSPCPGDVPASFDPIVGSVVAPNGSGAGIDCDYSTGDIVNITAGKDNYCFTLTQVCQAPSFSLVFTPVVDCDDPACGEIPPPVTYSYENCADGTFVTTDVDAGLQVDSVYSFCCDVPGPDFHTCYKYLGNIGRPLEGDFGGCTLTGESFDEFETPCQCCINKCNYLYQACPGDGRPKTMPEEIIWKHQEGDGENCACDGPFTLPVFQHSESGDTWCYNPIEESCEDDTIGFSVAATSVECGNEEFCPNAGEETLRYKMCSDEGEVWFYQDALDPIPAPFNTVGLHYIGDLAGVDCVKKNCCITVESTTLTGDPLGWTTYVSLMECDPLNNSTALNCDCCRFYDVATYQACDAEGCTLEGYPTLNIDVCDWGKTIGQDWKPGTAPNIIKVSIGDPLECCYEYTGPACSEETFLSSAGKEYVDLSYDPAVTTCGECEVEYYKYTKCVDDEVVLLTTNILNPGIEGLTLPFTGMVQDATNCENDSKECCVTIIEKTTDVGATTKIDCWDPAGINIAFETENCDCCVHKDVILYNKCKAECGIPDEYNSIYIDTCEWFNITQASGSLPPEFVYVEYGGVSCCYERGEWACVQPTTPKPDSIIDSLEASCESCVETLQNFKITNCNDPLDVTITNQDLSANVGGGAWLGSNDVCYTVENYVGPASLPLGITLDTQYEVEPYCDCCIHRDIRTYIKCGGVGGTACDAMPLNVNIDTNTVPGGPATPDANIIISELANPANECCYVLIEEPPCAAADTLYSYKASFDTCEELPEECVEGEDSPKMLISGQDGVQDGTTPINVPNPIGEFPPYVVGDEGASWFSVQIPEDAVLPEGMQWSTMYAVEGFYVGEAPLQNVGNQAGSAFLPAFNFDSIGDIQPGAIYQLTASADFTIDPSVVEGMEGNILFFTVPGEDVAEEKSAIIPPEGGKKTIYEESLENEATAAAAAKKAKPGEGEA